MNPERHEEIPNPLVSNGRAGSLGTSADLTRHEATVVVRGDTVGDREPKSAPIDPPRRQVAEAKLNMERRLPRLDDDADVGVQKEHVVVRDGKADLAFTGTLLASAAPPSTSSGEWHEYRIYETTGGKHVFSRLTRSIYAEQQDIHEAEKFDPSPSSVPAQLLRGARDLTHLRPVTWKDAAVNFFGYDPLAKALFRKLGGQFEEHVS